ncbi:hypothetical protein [Bradyrhizobium sp.]|uniref:hypothetical protein n=1 Tax=Bradyrhizobium sp. TaxID=376 RepID=UPI003BAEBA8A
MCGTDEPIFDPNHHYFPEFDEPSMVAFLMPFGRLMFGYANLDREIVDIVSAATGRDDFVRRDASNVSNQVEKFIVKHVGGIAEIEAIKEQLDRSIRLYHLRNDLAHGHWWRFDPSNESIEIRRDRIRDGEQFITVTRSQLEEAAEQFEDIEVNLFKIRRAIEARRIEEADNV